jgi:hypothetical protein
MPFRPIKSSFPQTSLRKVGYRLIEKSQRRSPLRNVFDEPQFLP